MINIKDMLKNLKPPLQPLTVQAWGVEVFIRSMTEAERAEFIERELSAEDSGQELSVLDRLTATKNIVIQCTSDAEGQQVFGDISDLSHLPPAGFGEIYIAVLQLTNGSFDYNAAKKN